MRSSFIALLLVFGLSAISRAMPNENDEKQSDGEVVAAKLDIVPKIVSVSPQDGATDVATITEIKIRFDQPMKPGSISLEWSGHGKNGGFRPRGGVAYDADLFEFTLPVVLKSSVTHEILVNDGAMSRALARSRTEATSGFRSAMGTAAKPFKWSFTSSEPAAADDGPKIVSIHPEPDTEIALATELRVRFDAPMDPTCYELGYDRGSFGAAMSLFGDVSYDTSRHEFRLPVAFPANWNGILQLRGFRGIHGRTAESRHVKFRTLREPLSAERRDALSKLSESEVLKTLLDSVKIRHQNIGSAKVTATSRMIHSNFDWGYSISRTEATFAKENKKFFGDISEIMPGSAVFQVGSDGEKCWFRFNDEITVCPVTEISQRTVSIADGFGLLAGSNDISRLKLEYAGKEERGGRTFHRVRGWSDIDSQYFTMTHHVGHLKEWLIDADTLLVFRAVSGTCMETEFNFELINKDIPDKIFQAPNGPNLVTKEAPPLDEGYSRRFLKVSDGTNGRMSLRWGKVGEKGTSSSGLN